MEASVLIDYINCPICDHPNRIETEIQFLKFPDDTDLIIALMEGSLGAINCAICHEKISLLIPLVALNDELQTVIIVAPANLHEQIRELIKRLIPDWKIEYCKSYSELYFGMAPWINSHIVEVFKDLLNSRFFDQSPEEQISRLSPLFLRIFKSQIDGKLIQNPLNFSGPATKEKHEKRIGEMYTLVVTHLAQQLLETAVKLHQIPEIDSRIRERIPAICLTPEILSNISNNCIDLQDPKENPAEFGKGFVREYLNAIIYSHANTVNLRRADWISYLVTVWSLSQDENMVFDKQFFLSTETIRRTVRFQDLWDIAVAGSLNLAQGDYKEILVRVSEMMKAFGFEKEFEETLETNPFRITPQPGKEIPSAVLKDTMLQTILKNYALNSDSDESIELGGTVGRTVDYLLKSGQKEAAFSLAEEMLILALDAEDYFAAIAIGTKVIEVINKAEEYDFAFSISYRLIPIMDDSGIHEKVGASHPSLLLYFFNEIGNVFRYRHEYEGALGAYDVAETIYSIIPEQKRDPNNFAVLQRNRAIIYRETGKFRKAKTIFDSELEQRPEDHQLVYSLVMLEVKANRFESALEYLNRAIKIVGEKSDIEAQSEYLLSRGIIKNALGEGASGLDDLITAYEMSLTISPLRALRIASAAIRFHSEQPEHREFIERCLNIVIDEIQSKRQWSKTSMVLTMLTTIAEKYLEENRSEELLELFKEDFEWLDSLEGALSWRYGFIRAWLAYQSGELENCWPEFKLILDFIDRSVPTGEDVSFSVSWMHDKEKFQQVISSVAVDLFDRGILPPIELLKIYEITNGREIGSRLSTQLSAEEIARTVKHYSEKYDQTLNIFFPIKAGETVRMCYFSSATGLIDLSALNWNADELGKIRKETYSAFKQANPADLTLLDQKIQAWENLGSQIGIFVEAHLNSESQVCFLPGRDFTGLPLHLIKMADGSRLLEKVTVRFAPNFATLLASSKKRRKKARQKIALITVTKRRESEQFRVRALSEAKKISTLLGGSGKIFKLEELQATHENIIDLLPRVDQIFFICHGVYAGPRRGYGICIADKHQLPPSLFPIEEVPDLERFILTWEDFEDVEVCPPLVVSIACSSGITEVVTGGTRYGLEQTLFGKGTRNLISPLWDIDQELGLEWIKSFCETNLKYNNADPGQAYRETCLIVKKLFPHPFFWGCFALNGAVFTEDKS
jgi:CHAT domain-containing protein/tetratricopeptide (TPR) repeat protein